MRKILALFLLLAVPNFAVTEEKSFQPIAGEHYRVLKQKIPKLDNTHIFLWYGCKACFQLEAEYAAQNPLWQRLPVSLYKSWRPQTKIFYTLRALNQSLDIDRQLMSAINTGKLNLSDFSAQQKFIENILNTDGKVERHYLSAEVNKQAAYSDKLQYQIKITKVPAALVAGKYYLDLSMVSDLQQFVQSVNFLEQLIEKNTSSNNMDKNL